MIRVLQLPDSLSVKDGRMSVIMSIYRNLDKSKIQFDFLAQDIPGESYKDEIEMLGGKTFLIDTDKMSLQNIRKTARKVFNSKRYKYVHYHAISKWGIILGIARRNGIKVITHSHSTFFSDNIFKSIRNKLFSLNILLVSDKLVAVSPEAGEKLFGHHSFQYIPNIIDFKKFCFSNQERQVVRKAFQVKKDDILIGHIGRFKKQKNHIFIIKAFCKLNQQNDHYKLMLVGDGPLQPDIKKTIYDLKLENSVILCGAHKDVVSFYSAFDLFWLPSLYEGLPTVGLEAQANGLSVIASSEITAEIKITDVTFLPIRGNESINRWVDITTLRDWKHQVHIEKSIKKSKFIYQEVINAWIELYK